MADTTATNGAQENAIPALNALAQYCKDFSFENPNAPRSLQQQSEGPQINLQVNVNAKQLAEADFEVELTLEGNAKVGTEMLFAFELTYSGVFRVQNMPAGPDPSGGDDRMPAPAVPVRAPDRGRCGAQWRLPAALHRPDRFRGALSPARDRNAGREQAQASTLS